LLISPLPDSVVTLFIGFKLALFYTFSF